MGYSYRLSLVDGTDVDADKARRFEQEVFLFERGVSAHKAAEEFAPYENHSDFLVVTPWENVEVIGMARIIRPGGTGLKALNDIAGDPWHVPPSRVAGECGIPLDTTMDAATIALDWQHRRRAGDPLGAALLLHGIYRYASRRGMTHLVAVADDQVLSRLHDIHVHLNPICGARPHSYLGAAAVTPVYGSFAQFDTDMRSHDKELARMIGDGVGLVGDVAYVDDQLLD